MRTLLDRKTTGLDQMDREEKKLLLQQRLRETEKLAVAYSGGIDSHFLLEAAVRALGKERVLAVFCSGVMVPDAETEAARAYLEARQIPFRFVPADVLSVAEFARNDKRRCYFCKKYLMGMIRELAAQQGFETVADGKNADDASVYRPGAQAAQELGIWSPLYECGFTKSDIRESAREWGLELWNKPSMACLASRFPYDTELTAEKLKKVELAEQILHKAGFAACRVRVHGEVARIEVPKESMETLLQSTAQIQAVRQLGFPFVTMDLEGIRSGVFD